MNKLSKKRKKVLMFLVALIVILFVIIAGFAIFMIMAYNNQYKWNDMITNEREWISDNQEIVFQMYEPDDYEWYSNDLESVFSYYGLKYKGKINNKDVLVYFGAIERKDKTIKFYDSDSKELLVKADVKSYSGEKFKIKITKDEIGLSEDKYTFVCNLDSKSLI